MSERAEKNYISDEVLDALIAAHDGDMALLYLYRLRGGPADRENAARALCRTLQDVGSAEEKLERLDLLGKGGSPAPSASPAPKGSAPARSAVAERLSPAQELPEYTAEEISRRSRENSALSSIYQEAARVMGRTLSGNDLRVLFGIYDHLGLPPEVILELLHWCDELCQLRYKDHRKPSSLFLQKEAYAWADREIMTLEQAEEHIRAQRQRRSDLGRIQSALHLDLLSPTQKTDICLWLDQGFDEEGILIAADRTVTNTGALKWNYLRKILQRWHESGLHSADAIREKDPVRSAATAARPKLDPAGEKPLDEAALSAILEKI